MQECVPVVAIVDDEPCVRRALGRLLDLAGYEARPYASGGEFLDHLDGIDLVILDLHLPGMSGLDVQKALAGRHSRIPVVVLTGNDTPANRARSLAEGARAYLTKPIDDEELLHALRSLAPQPGVRT
jgi:FixJ family two-component response regulator